MFLSKDTNYFTLPAVYPNLNHNTLSKNNETPSEVIAIATDNTSIDNKQNENSEFFFQLNLCDP